MELVYEDFKKWLGKQQAFSVIGTRGVRNCPVARYIKDETSCEAQVGRRLFTVANDKGYFLETSEDLPDWAVRFIEEVDKVLADDNAITGIKAYRILMEVPSV